MTTRETRGAPRRESDPEKTPRPRRSMPGHVETGAGHLESTRRTRSPRGEPLRRRSRCHPRRLRAPVWATCGAQAGAPTSQNSACSRATTPRAGQGTSPALGPRCLGANEMTSGPCRRTPVQVERRAARQALLSAHSTIPSRARVISAARALLAELTCEAPVDSAPGARVDNDDARERLNLPTETAAKCKNGPCA